MPTATVASASHTAVTTGWTGAGNAFSTTGDNVYAIASPGRSSTISGDFFPSNIDSTVICDGARIVSVTATSEWYMSAAVTGGTLGIQLGNASGLVGSETTNTTKTSSGLEGQDTASVNGTYFIGDIRSALTNVKARVRCTKANTNAAMTGNLDLVKFDITYIPSSMACL